MMIKSKIFFCLSPFALLLILSFSQVSSAQKKSLMPGVDNFANTLIELGGKKWDGPTQPFPIAKPLPQNLIFYDSISFPLRLSSETLRRESLKKLMPFFENAFLSIKEAQFPIDKLKILSNQNLRINLLITESSNLNNSWVSKTNGEDFLSYLDSTLAYPTIDLGIGHSISSLQPLFIPSLIDALLFHLDPAESLSSRMSTTLFITEELTQTKQNYPLFSARASQDQFPKDYHCSIFSKTWKGSPKRIEESVSFLRWLSHQEKVPTTQFIMQLWDFARQHSWEKDSLRASPHFWEVLKAYYQSRHIVFRNLVIDFKINQAINEFKNNKETRLPLWKDLPKKWRNKNSLIEQYGSAYHAIDIKKATRNTEIKTWLQGEYGVDWSLAILLLNKEKKEIRRLKAPSTKFINRIFLPIEIEEKSAFAFFIITNLGEDIINPYRQEKYPRGYQLIISK